ncbi:MAG: outer membrane lipoprotein carrier protein LolA [Bacteroidota bacterium]|nr:outer membrane lipoprotein carrier protein LolA [Bacteroidota bacterium]
MPPVYRILLILVVLWPGRLTAQDADAIFASVIDRYGQGIQASFEYTMSSEVWDQDLVYTGQIQLLDDQYRVENDTELIIGRGPETWIYRPADSQILISRAMEDELAFAPGHLFANYQKNFSADALWSQMIGGSEHYVLELIPLPDNSPLRAASLWIRKSDGIITRIETAGHNDTLMTIRLTDVVLSPAIASDTFIMPTPAGIEVIDLR